MDVELFESLSAIFADLVRWCVREGKTELNGIRAAVAALRAIGVDDNTLEGIRRQYVISS